MRTLLVKSYAKINIGLNISGVREDGYHELDMIMVPVQLHDSIRMSELKGKKDNFVTFDDFSMYQFKYNLATFAIDSLASKYNFTTKFRLIIHKNIPIEAGFGGGSSNAAFTLLAVNDSLKLGVSKEELMAMGKMLGADVPFFISCKPMRCKGIGEIMTPIQIKNDYSVLLIKPKQGCSTKEVFLKCNEMENKHVNIDLIQKALEEGDDELLEKELGNSLEEAAVSLVPEIKEIIQILKEEGLKIVSMSGSGSGIFALSTDAALVKRIAKKYDKKYWLEVTKIIK